MTKTITPASEPPSSIALAIRQARAAQHMNVRDFGEALGVSPNAISLYEKGKDEPGTKRVSNWCQDERDWVHHLGVAIIQARITSLMDIISTRLPKTITAQ